MSSDLALLWDKYFFWIVLTIFSFTVIPYITALIPSILGRFSKSFLVANLGEKSQLVVGGVGAVVHEMGHGLVALLFGHHLDHVKLFNLNFQNEDSLGSVEHSWKTTSVYQRFGNFFIGLAPFYSCSLVLLLLQAWIFSSGMPVSPTSLEQFTVDAMTTHQMFGLSDLFHSALATFSSTFSNAKSLSKLFYLVASIIIASTGFDLSSSDFRTTRSGISVWISFQAIIAAIVLWMGRKEDLIQICIYFALLSFSFMFYALLSILVSILFTGIFFLLNFIESAMNKQAQK